MARAHDMEERRIALTHHYAEHAKRPSLLDRCEQIAKILSLILIPIFVAVLGQQAVQIVTNTADRDLRKEYFSLAWKILSTAPPIKTQNAEPSPDSKMRKWATDYLFKPDYTRTGKRKNPRHDVDVAALVSGQYLLPPPEPSQSPKP
jgi:hypothetical protein